MSLMTVNAHGLRTTQAPRTIDQVSHTAVALKTLRASLSFVKARSRDEPIVNGTTSQAIRKRKNGLVSFTPQSLVIAFVGSQVFI